MKLASVKKVILVAVGLLTLAGCASHRLSDAQRVSIIDNYITSEKLKHSGTITAFDMDSWTALSDQYLIIRTSPFKPYLVKLASRCQDLDYAPTLVVNSRIPNTLSEGFDSVYTPENHTFKCFISRIYPLSKDQNKALIQAVNPPSQDKPIEKSDNKKDENKPDNKVKTLVPTAT